MKKNLQTNTSEIQRIIRDYYEKYTPIKWTTQKKWKILRNIQSPKTEPGTNRKFEQTN